MFPLIQLPKKLLGIWSYGDLMRQLRFPLIQLPKKLLGSSDGGRIYREARVSINSTSEEVIGTSDSDSVLKVGPVSINSTSEEVIGSGFWKPYPAWSVAQKFKEDGLRRKTLQIILNKAITKWHQT